MSRYWFAGLATIMLGVGLAAQAPPQRKPAPAAPTTLRHAQGPEPGRATMAVSHPTGTMTIEAQNALVAQYCATCHSERGKAGGVSLATFDAATVDTHPEVPEKMLRKLRAGMMPPSGAKRPDAAVLAALAAAMETRIDAAAAVRPQPGRRTFQRLNRAEYARTIHDLLDLDVAARP